MQAEECLQVCPFPDYLADIIRHCHSNTSHVVKPLKSSTPQHMLHAFLVPCVVSEVFRHLLHFLFQGAANLSDFIQDDIVHARHLEREELRSGADPHGATFVVCGLEATAATK